MAISAYQCNRFTVKPVSPDLLDGPWLVIDKDMADVAVARCASKAEAESKRDAYNTRAIPLPDVRCPGCGLLFGGVVKPEWRRNSVHPVCPDCDRAVTV